MGRAQIVANLELSLDLDYVWGCSQIGKGCASWMCGQQKGGACIGRKQCEQRYERGTVEAHRGDGHDNS